MAYDYVKFNADIVAAIDADDGSPEQRAAVERLHKLTGDYLAAHAADDHGAATGHDAALRAAERAYLHARARTDLDSLSPVGFDARIAAGDLVALLDADTAGDPVT